MQEIMDKLENGKGVNDFFEFAKHSQAQTLNL